MEKEIPANVRILHIPFSRNLAPQRYSKLVRVLPMGAIAFYICAIPVNAVQKIYKIKYKKNVPNNHSQKVLSCRYNMDTNRAEARFEDGTTLSIDCIAIEDEYGNTPAQRAELDWLLYNKPLEYFLSAGQCAIGDGGAFVPPAAVAGDGSTSNAGRWIRDFYDTTGGRRRGGTSGTGGSNASAGMVHIK